MTALSVLVLVVSFCAFFQLTKQVPVLAAVNASADDPYDAIGSFGVQASVCFALLSVGRRLWRGRAAREASPAQRFWIARAELAAVLCVAVTLAGDVVAMLRHTGLWAASAAGWQYAAMLGLVAALAALAGVLVMRTSREVRGPRTRRGTGQAAIAVLAALLVLAIYPEGIRQGVIGALATVLVGVVLLFVPVRLTLVALVPDALPPAPVSPAFRWLGPGWVTWAVVTGAAALVGVLLVVAETLKESAHVVRLTQLLLVGSVYVGLETTGVLFGFALLRGPLGLSAPGRPTSASSGRRPR